MYQSLFSGLNIPESQTAGLNVDPGQAFRGDQGASELQGQLSRAQWNDWKARFSPYIGTLSDIAQDEGAPATAAVNASGAMGQAFDANQQALEQDREGLGIQQTGAQADASERRTAIKRQASQVSAGNQARISAQDRQSSILAGGMGLSNIPGQELKQ
ncbi:hypothetical protein [Chromohalobacter sp. 296-RDG]|uniref:hypothetical protein n=1 Tax=Chromohalobacter sp. 296-RDG TaxID=2994062 RepID=UPI0024690335|nr:hypothetical protein [Chromohalobacter sp. 296-RDG]